MSVLKNLKENKNVIDNAINVQMACSSVGFDWQALSPVIDKVSEELEEIKEALENPAKGKREIEEEFGDLLFACLNLSRHLKVDAKDCLQVATEKFKSRFKLVETLAGENQQELSSMSPEMLDALWRQAKRKSK